MTANELAGSEGAAKQPVAVVTGWYTRIVTAEPDRVACGVVRSLRASHMAPGGVCRPAHSARGDCSMRSSCSTLPPVAAVILMLVVVASGCSFTHRIRLQGADLDPVPLSRSARTRVAIVLAPPEFATTQETSTDGHTFIFEDLNIFYERAFRSALQGRVATLDFVPNATPGYDAYVFPSLSLQASGAFVHQCSATYGLRVVDGRGRTLAAQTAQGQHPFGPISAAEAACTVAMLQAYAEVTLPVLGSLDAIAP